MGALMHLTGEMANGRTENLGVFESLEYEGGELMLWKDSRCEVIITELTQTQVNVRDQRRPANTLNRLFARITIYTEEGT